MVDLNIAPDEVGYWGTKLMQGRGKWREIDNELRANYIPLEHPASDRDLLYGADIAHNDRTADVERCITNVECLSR